MVMCTTPCHRSCLAEWATMGHGAMGTCPALCPEYHVCLGWSRVGLALDIEGIIKGQQPVAAPTHPLSCVSQSESPQESPGGTSHIPISTAGVKVRSGRGLSISIIVLFRRVSVGRTSNGAPPHRAQVVSVPRSPLVTLSCHARNGSGQGIQAWTSGRLV